VPGFAEQFGAAAGEAVRSEVDLGMAGDGGDGDDVPDVERDDVGGDEVGVGEGVVAASVLHAEFVAIVAELAGGTDLHARDFGATEDRLIEAVAVAEGFGGAEAEREDLLHEADFGPLAQALAGEGNIGFHGELGLSGY